MCIDIYFKKIFSRFAQRLRKFLRSHRPRFLLKCRSHDARGWWNDVRNCTKHYSGSLPGVLSRVFLRDSPLCIYRRGYLRALRRLLITISTSVFYRENGKSAIWKTNGRMFPHNYILFGYNRTSLRYVVLFWYHALDDAGVECKTHRETNLFYSLLRVIMCFISQH